MTTMNVEIYEAFLDAGTEDAKARAAAKMIPSPNHLVSRANLAEVSSEMKTALARADIHFDEMDARLAKVETRLDEVNARLTRIEARLDEMDARFDKIDARFDKIDARFDKIDARLVEIDARLDKVDTNQARQESRMLKSMMTLSGIVCGLVLGAISIATAIILNYLPSL